MIQKIFHNKIWWLISDTLVLVERNLLRYVRLPQLLVFSTIQPVMFLLLFTYVFGGAIKGSSGSYINFLLPGILVQTAIFGAIHTGVGLTEDLSKGLIDRFKSLPMARSAVLSGRTIADMLRNIFVVVLMFVVGYFIGFRLQGSIADAVSAFAIILLFGFAFAWISAAIGMAVKNVETAQVAGFIWVFPLVFTSSIFVPVDTMPMWLQAFAAGSPVTITVDAVRALMLHTATTAETARYSLESLAWIVFLLIIFMPLAIFLYRRS